MNSEHQHHLNLELATSSLILDIFFFNFESSSLECSPLWFSSQGCSLLLGLTRVIYLNIWCPTKKGFMARVIYLHTRCPSKKGLTGVIYLHIVCSSKKVFRLLKLIGVIYLHTRCPSKKVLWLLKLSSIKFYSFSLFLRGPIKSLHQLLFFFMKSKFFSQCQSYIRRNLKTLLFSSVSLF